MVSPVRVQFEGAIYHVMARGNNGRPIVRTKEDRRAWYEALERFREIHSVVVYSHALMANHYHLLLETPRGNLSSFMRDFGSVYVAGFKTRHKHRGCLFQSRYKGILVEKESYLLTVVRYIHRQGLEAGIVSRIEAYPWTSYSAYLGKEQGLVTVNQTAVRSLFGRNFLQEFKKFHRSRTEAPEPKHIRGVPYYGRERFGRQLESVTERRKQKRSKRAKISLPYLEKAFQKELGLSLRRVIRRSDHEEGKLRYQIVRWGRELSGSTYVEMGERWGLKPARLAQQFHRIRGKGVDDDTEKLASRIMRKC